MYAYHLHIIRIKRGKKECVSGFSCPWRTLYRVMSVDISWSHTNTTAGTNNACRAAFEVLVVGTDTTSVILLITARAFQMLSLPQFAGETFGVCYLRSALRSAHFGGKVFVHAREVHRVSA